MYSLQYYRFLIDQQGFLRVTSREQVCQHITDLVFLLSSSCQRVLSVYVLVLFAQTITHVFSLPLFCDWHLWTYRPFTSFYHATSTEPRQNRKPCGQLSSLASETHHRTAFSKLMNLFLRFTQLNIKIIPIAQWAELDRRIGLEHVLRVLFWKSESLVILRSNHDKATNVWKSSIP